jgi:hypothetical protein
MVWEPRPNIEDEDDDEYEDEIELSRKIRLIQDRKTSAS